MTRAEQLILAELLERASDVFSNHGCNFDLRPLMPREEDRRALHVAYEQWNSQGREEIFRTDYHSDWALMSWFAARLRKGEVEWNEREDGRTT